MSTISNLLPTPPNGFSTTLSSGISSTDLSIPLNSVAGLPTEGIGVIFQKDVDGNPVASSIEFIHWTGVAGNSLTLTDTGDRGITGSASGAQAHNAGDTFEVWVHSQYYGGLKTSFEVEHNPDGTHKGFFYSTTITSSSTPTPTGDRKKNELFITALSENATIQAPSGTAVDGNVLLIRIKDNGTARTLSFNSIYQGFAFSLPTTTTVNKTMYLGFVYNSSATKWQLLSMMEG